MRLRILTLVLALLLSCSWVSAQTYTFGFMDGNGNLSCDYLDITVDNGIASGVDNMSVCWSETSPTLVGLLSSNPQVAQYGVVPSGVDLADNALDWQAQQYTGGQMFLHTALKCNALTKSGKPKGKYGWILLAAFDGFLSGVNYGYLSCTIPSVGDGNVLQHGTTFGKLTARQKR